jgi:DNA-binding beta-propeller fold protein YncE
VNIEDLNEIVEIDIQKLAISKRFSINPGEEPTGMDIDIVHHRIFSACGNKMMVVLDYENGKVTDAVPIGAGCDGATYDPETGYIFCANGGDGTLSVIKETSSAKFEVADTITTQPGARTIAIDPMTHDILLPVGQFGPAGGAAPKSGSASDSFAVLVVGN